MSEKKVSDGGLDLTILEGIVDKIPAITGKKTKIETNNSEFDDFVDPNDSLIPTVENITKLTNPNDTTETEETTTTASTQTNESKETIQTNEQTQTNEDSDPYKIWAETWKEKGFIEYDDEEFDKAEDKEEFIYQKYDDKFRAEIDNYKQSQHPFIKQLMDLDDENIDISKVLYHEANIQQYSNIDKSLLETDVRLQKNVIKDLLIKTGQYTPVEAETEVEEIEDAGPEMLLKKAEKALPKLIEFEKKQESYYIAQEKQRQKDALDNYNSWLESQTTYVNKLDTILPGIKLSQKEKQQILDNYTKVDREGKTALQKTIEKDPAKFNAIVSYLFTVKNLDFSALEQAATTKASQKIKQTLNTYKETPSKLGSVDVSIFKKVIKKNGY